MRVTRSVYYVTGEAESGNTAIEANLAPDVSVVEYFAGIRRVRVVMVSFGDPHGGGRSILIEPDTTDPASPDHPYAHLDVGYLGIVFIQFTPRLDRLP